MLVKKLLLIVISSLVILSTNLSGTARGRSVYVISNTEVPDETSRIQAYKIDGNNLSYQETYTSDIWGAVGLAIDASEYGNFLFVTFEGEDEMELVNAKSMEYVDVVTATGASNLAGIVVDQSKQKVYVLKRQDNRLYVYLWNPITRKLTLEGDTYKTLENIGTYPNGAFGIALDQTKKHLYVTDSTNTVRFYDANDPGR